MQENLNITRRVSDGELERRWKAVRGKMNEAGIDYLVMQNSERFLGGTVRWFTDFGARHQMPYTVIFPSEGDMTTIVCGSQPPHDNFPPRDVSRGLGDHLGHVYFPNIPQTNTYDAELAVKVLSAKKRAPVIGWVEKAFIPMTFSEHLYSALPEAVFVDATDLVDQIRAIKSAEEIGYIRESAALEDGAVHALTKIIRPGMKDADVYAEVHYYLSKNGCEGGLVQVGSGPMYHHVAFNTPQFQNRTIQFGDVVNVLIECTGPCGYFTEMLRPVIVGMDPTEEFRRAFEAAKEIQGIVAAQMKPGVQVKKLWETYENYLKENEFAAPHRSFAHAQGQSYMERPNIRPDEDWLIRENMNITVHPSVQAGTCTAMLFDNFLVRPDGGERLHQTPRQILIAEC